MHKNQIMHARVLSISLSSRGFGHAVMEGNNRLVDFGNKVFHTDKNTRTLAHIKRLVIRNAPDVLVLQDVHAKGTHRAPRIKRLDRQVMELAKECGLKTVKITQREQRSALLGDENGTRYEMGVMMAKRFPDELASRLPPKRKPWQSEDNHMDFFDAVGLAVAFQTPGK